MLADAHRNVVLWMVLHMTPKFADDLCVAARNGLTVGQSVLERVDTVEHNEA